MELFDLGTDPGGTRDLSAERRDLVARLRAWIVDLASAIAAPLLVMEAVKLTFYIPPISGDPSVLLNQGD